MEEYVEVRQLYKEMKTYKEWTKVTRFLAYGLMGVEVREIIKNVCR